MGGLFFCFGGFWRDWGGFVRDFMIGVASFDERLFFDLSVCG